MKESDRPPFPSPAWRSKALVERENALNRKCMTYWVSIAPLSQWESVFARQDLWTRMDDKACQRAAECRVLLVEFSRVPMAALQRPYVERELALMNEILTEGWGMYQCDPCATQAFFDTDTQVLKGLKAGDIAARVQDLVRYLRPRFCANRVFWNDFLEAALKENTQALRDIHLVGMQFRDS